MRVIVEQSKLLENLANAQKFAGDATIAVMVKDFYAPIVDQQKLNTMGVRFWSGSMYFGYNYIVGNNRVGYHRGGIVMSVAECMKLKVDAENFESHFEAYIPMDVGDNREGLNRSEVIEMLLELKDTTSRYFTVAGVMITAGCLNADCLNDKDLLDIISLIRTMGYKVSVGGSFFLGKAMLGTLPKVDEIRIGEFYLYGTIPFTPELAKLENAAIKVESEVVHVYPDRKHILVEGGRTKMDSRQAKVLDPNLKVVACSTEYTIMAYEGKEPNIRDTVEFVPEYHSLITLLER